MIDRQAATRGLMNDCKGGTGYRSAAFQACDEALGELSFAAPQFAFERQDRSHIKLFRELAADCFGLSRAIGNERSHLAIVDFRFSIFDLTARFGSIAPLEIVFASIVPNERCRAAVWQRATRNPPLRRLHR